MTIRDLFRGPAAATSIALTAITCAHTGTVAPDRDFSAVVHTLIVGPINGGRTNPNDVFVAADSTSAYVMRMAQVPT